MKTLGLKNIITEIKNSTDSLNSRLDITNERIPDPERQISRKYIDWNETKKKKTHTQKMHEAHMRHKKQYNTRITGGSERGARYNTAEAVLKSQ